MASSSGRSTGRLQRNTNDTVPILGSALLPAIDNSVNDALHETISQGMSQATRRNYRCRIAKIIKHFKENFPEYYRIGVRELTQEEISDRTKYFFNQTEDLVYTGLNVQFFMFFLSSTDKRTDGKLKSHEDLRKYRDAVLWGAKVAGQHLPSSFYDSMEMYLIAYKKKFATAKKQGHVDEYSTDPIPLPVYRFLLRRSIETNNIFAWTWTLLQWNCMARSASIDCLAFHNLSLGTDSLVIKYDETKADKGNLVKNERLFLKKGTKEGAGSTKYHKQVVGLVRGKEENIATHMKFEKLNPYGLRKGAATHAVSRTTAAPSIPSIARRGEWSIGSVLDVYWHFGSVGDHYLGRILCGLDPNDTNFAILPPHWKVEDPLGNTTIRDALNLLYGPILQSYSGKSENPTGIVLRCMACIVYHSDRLLETMVKYPGHDFSKIPILHNSTLLHELRGLVTIEPTPGVMVVPTGVPPHVGLAIQVAKVLDKLDVLVQQFGDHGDNLMLAVEEALDNKAWESGHVTGSRLKEILDEYRKESIEAVDRQLTGMRAELRQVIRQGGQGPHGEDSEMDGFEIDLESGGGTGGGGGQKVRTVFSYDGRFFAVPRGYQFPKANLKEGLRCWLKDQVVSADGMEKVKAFKTMSPTMLPKELSRQFRTNWQPFFKFLDPVLKDLPRETNDMTDEVFETVYGNCMDFLRERVSYLWKERSNPREYSIATWSNKVSYSSIKKLGTEEDKSFLTEPTKRNQEKQEGRRKRQRKENARHPRRQQRTICKNARVGRNASNDGDETFATAFEHVGEMTEAMMEREEEIRLQVAAEDREANHTEEVRRIQEEGWTSRPIPLVRNYGDVSGFDRQCTGQQINQVYPPESIPVRGVGLCCISGCNFPEMQLLHRCNKCKQFIHMVCAESFNNLAEDERYCDKCIPGR